ncbi:MAG: metallophosphoesterase [Roseiflexaceae bacterium]|nr:metallophosphoesterase [Roseiflexaceae bacterium]
MKPVALFSLCLALCAIASCGKPPESTVRVFRTPIPTLAPISTAATTIALATPAPTIEPSPSSTVLLAPTIAPTQTPQAPAAWRFVVLGDTRTEGLDPPAMMGKIVGLATAAKPAITLAVGDLINALDDQESVREQWLRWRAAIAPLGESSTAMPWLLPTPGNHDVQGNAWATDMMREAFPELPENGPPGLARLSYAYDYNGVRFISVHSEMYGDAHHFGDEQLAWLESQLQNNPNRYTFVFSHDPAFPIGPHVGSALDVYPKERDRFWALLGQYRVTAYICGHEHLYNRQVINGVPQLIVGTSGSWPYGGFGGDYFHYLVAEVRADVLEMVVYDSDGTERDRFTLP